MSRRDRGEKKLILDLHVHSKYSIDSPVKPEEYARLIIESRDEYHLDGFILMEHNYWVTDDDEDLAALSSEYGLTILAGSEVDTFWGHMLVYGMTEKVYRTVRDGERRKQDPQAFAELCLEEGAALVPAHPFRGWLGAGDRATMLAGVKAIEVLNGANSDLENLAAMKLASRHGFFGTGGSDAHFLAELGAAATYFPEDVKNVGDLARMIKQGKCKAIGRETTLSMSGRA